MEWVKTTAKTVPQAIELALDNLGVDESEAEIVVIEEPRTGLFGRVKGAARVEARIKPVTVRPKADRRNRRGDRKSKRGNGRGRSNGGNDRGGRNRSGGGNGKNNGRDGSNNKSGNRQNNQQRGESDNQGGQNQDRNQGGNQGRNRQRGRGQGQGQGQGQGGGGRGQGDNQADRSRNRSNNNRSNNRAGGKAEAETSTVDDATVNSATSAQALTGSGTETAQGGSGSGSSRKRRRGGRGRGGGDTASGGVAGAAAAVGANSKNDGDGANSHDPSRNRAKVRSKPSTEETPVEHVDDEVVEEHLSSFLGGLATAFGVDGDVNVDTSEPGVMVASVDGQHGLMVGPKGRTLDAIQELTRVSAQRSAPSAVRIRVDVGGYREQRAEAIGNFARKAADKAIDSGAEVKLDPMPASDRKSVHDALTENDRVETRSIGTEPRRRVLIVPLAGPGDDSEEE